MTHEAQQERAMKVQEVILRTLSGQYQWHEAAEILGISERTIYRWKWRYEHDGYNGLYDHRRQRPSPKRVPVAVAQQVRVLAELAPGRFRLGVGPSHRSGMESTFGVEWNAPLGHLREESRELPRPDDEQPPARAVHGGERRPVERQLIRRLGRADRDAPGSHVEAPHDRVVVQHLHLHARRQLEQPPDIIALPLDLVVVNGFEGAIISVRGLVRSGAHLVSLRQHPREDASRCFRKQRLLRQL